MKKVSMKTLLATIVAALFITLFLLAECIAYILR